MGIDTCTEVGGEGHPHSMKKLNKKEDPRKGEGEFHKIVLEGLPYTHNMYIRTLRPFLDIAKYNRHHFKCFFSSSFLRHINRFWASKIRNDQCKEFCTVRKISLEITLNLFHKSWSGESRKCCISVFDVVLFFQEITGQTEQEQKYLERVEEEDFGQGTIGRVRIFMRMVVLVMVIIMMRIVRRTTARVRVIWMSTCLNTCGDAGMNSIEYFVVGQCSAQNW